MSTRSLRRRLLRCSLFALTLAAFSLVAVAGDVARPDAEWPQWRGPNRDGRSSETGMLESWSDEGPPLEWRIDGLGKGFSSVTLASGKIVTMGSRRRGASLIALSAKDGEKLWETEVGGGRPNSTPTIDGDRVYALGRDGDLVCARLGDGRELWRKKFSDDFDGKMMSGWGYSESPLVDGDRLVCTPGGNRAVIVALDKVTGEVRWKAKMPDDVGSRGHDGAGYSSIVVSEAAGVRQYVQLTGRGVISVAAEDGEFLWSYNRIANNTANIPTPIVRDDYVFCSTGYGTGAALLKVVRSEEKLDVEEVYFLESKTMQNHHGGMVLVGDHIYCGHGHNKGFPLCVEFETGKVAWHGGRGPGRGSAAVLYADGHLYFRYEDGRMALIEATPKEYVLKGSFEIASKLDKSWPHPVIVDGRLYLRDQDVLLCYKVKS